MEPCTEPVNAVAAMLTTRREIDSALEVTGKGLETKGGAWRDIGRLKAFGDGGASIGGFCVH